MRSLSALRKSPASSFSSEESLRAFALSKFSFIKPDYSKVISAWQSKHFQAKLKKYPLEQSGHFIASLSEVNESVSSKMQWEQLHLKPWV